MRPWLLLGLFKYLVDYLLRPVFGLDLSDSLSFNEAVSIVLGSLSALWDV